MTRQPNDPSERGINTAVKPTPIDAHLPIESIVVVGRHRHDLGDLESLAASIEDVDLLNPITITSDSRLIAGQRRLEACRQLGWATIPARIVASLDEASKLLRAERDENTERKEMLLSEKASLGEALYAIESVVGLARMAEAGRRAAPGRPAERCGTGATPFLKQGEPGSEQNKTRAVVAEAIDMAPRTYTDLRYVYRVANGLCDLDEAPIAEDIQAFAQSCLSEMDRTGTIRPYSSRVRAAVRARREAGEAKAAALSEPEPEVVRDGPRSDAAPAARQGPVDANFRSVAATTERFAKMRELAAAGHTSDQIAAVLGYASGKTAKTAAQEQGIDIPADAVMGRSRKKIDSNRIVRETVQTLEGLEMGLSLVDFDALDGAQVQGWTDSLAASIRVLNRLNRRLKEKAQ